MTNLILFVIAVAGSSIDKRPLDTGSSTGGSEQKLRALEPISQSQIELGSSEIGSGSFASVVSATLIKAYNSREAVVVKCMEKKRRNMNQALFFREIDILHHLHNTCERDGGEPDHTGEACIVELLGSFQDRKRLYLVLEPLGVDLCTLLTSSTEPLHLDDVRDILRQTLHAVSYCHDKGVIHCDIKAENLLLSRPGSVQRSEDGRITNLKIKLIDFGLSKRVGIDRLDGDGTFCFLSPEVVLSIPITFKLDMWGIGHLAYILRTCCNMFGMVAENDFENLLIMMQKVRRAPLPRSMIDRSSDPAKVETLVMKLKDASDEVRPWTIDSHILRGYGGEPNAEAEGVVDFVHTLMEFDPDHRPTAEQALRHPFLRR